MTNEDKNCRIHRVKSLKGIKLREYYLGVDVGTTVIKALLMDKEEKVLSIAFRKYERIKKEKGRVEQDPLEWWNKMGEVIREVIKGIDKKSIKALSLSTQGGTLIPIDNKGKPLRKAIIWMDTKADKESRFLNNKFGEDFFYMRSGSRVTPSSLLPKILWIKKNEKSIFKETYKFAQVPDFLNFKLTGEFVIDVSNASYSSFFNLRDRNWDEDILEKVDLEKDKFSEIKVCGEVAGNLSYEAADFLNLSPSTLVVTGAHDQTSAALGAKVINEGKILLSCGTAWVVYETLENLKIDPRGKYTVCSHALPKKWCLIAAMNGNVVLDWFIKNFCQKELKIAKTKNISIYELLVPKENYSQKIIFLPYLYGALAPNYIPQARGAFLGLNLEHNKKDLIRSIMEGLALQTRWTLEALEDSGIKIKEIKMAGGAAKSKFLPQIISNITGLPLYISSLQESASKGAAILAWRGVNGWDRKFPYREDKKGLYFTPKEQENQKYEKIFRLYKKSFRKCVPVFKEMNKNKLL